MPQTQRGAAADLDLRVSGGADGAWARADGPRTGGQDLYAAVMLADDDIWVAGARGKIYQWDGSMWLDRSIAGMVKTVRAMWIDDAGQDGWAAAEDGLVLRYR